MTCADCAGSSGDLVAPSPPAEEATASQDQAGQSCTSDGTGDCGVTLMLRLDSKPSDRKVKATVQCRIRKKSCPMNSSGLCTEKSGLFGSNGLMEN